MLATAAGPHTTAPGVIVSTAGNRTGGINSIGKACTGARTRSRARKPTEISGWRPGRAAGRRSDYDPSTGRYLQPKPLASIDPRMGKAPTYSYGENNPIKNSDPTGFFTVDSSDCPQWDEALALAKKWAGCTSSGANKGCRCQKALREDRACDICPFLEDGKGPKVLLKDDLDCDGQRPCAPISTGTPALVEERIDGHRNAGNGMVNEVSWICAPVGRSCCAGGRPACHSASVLAGFVSW
jgi:hypothetical protein